MKRSAAAQRILECGGKRRATPLSSGRDGGECSLRCVRAKAVSSLRSATAVPDAPGPPAGGGNLPGVGKKLVAIRGRVRQ